MRQKRKKADKQRDAWVRYNILVNESVRHKVSIRMLNEYPMHVRVTGECVVDYWPATQNAWLYGSKHEANVTAPEEVIALALQAFRLPEGASDHLRSLQ